MRILILPVLTVKFFTKKLGVYTIVVLLLLLFHSGLNAQLTSATTGVANIGSDAFSGIRLANHICNISGSYSACMVSSNTSVATVSMSGLVTWVSAGTTTITYTNNNGCQKTAIVTVNILPTCSITGGLNAICDGSSTTWSAPAGMSNYAWTGPETSI